MAHRSRKKAAASTPSYESERDALIEAFRQEEGWEWEAGLHWENLRERALWRKAGYPSASEFVKEELLERGLDVPPLGALSRWGQVARSFDKPVVLRVGMPRLIRALTFWRHRRKTDFDRIDPGSEPIDVPVPGGKFVEKALQACTYEELDAANRSFKRPVDGALSAKDAALEALLKTALAKAVGPNGQSKLALRAVKGEVFISSSFRAPLDRFSGLLKALGRFL